MEGLLGVENSVLQFDPGKLYPHNPDLDQLQVPFTETEIEKAVQELAKNKASGPDGLPNELLQSHWPLFKEELLSIIQSFYDHTLNLEEVNQANLIMIPKKEKSESVGDYRPISVMNVIPKLISKILANRLRRVLPELISSSQTAFIQGRQITENFNATREMLQHIASTGKSACFIKIDFSKAFDSVNWSYLQVVMATRGFPVRWLRWIQHLLSTASSRVVVNGETSKFFTHKKGLRQGDPLSPMLFDIAVDVLQKMVEVINKVSATPISSKLRKAILHGNFWFEY